MSSVGNEIFERDIVPAAYLYEVSEGAEAPSWCRLARLVKALASAIVEEDMLICNRSSILVEWVCLS